METDDTSESPGSGSAFFLDVSHLFLPMRQSFALAVVYWFIT
jgi:hypothetical protein